MQNFILIKGAAEMSVHQEEKPIDKSPDGRYLKFDEELGRGTFKTVYRGLDTETGITVAWCELQEEKFTKQERQRFREEASMLKKLEHPSIVKFYDYWESHETGKNNCIVLVTELMTSGTLKLYIKKFRTINVKILKDWSRQILCGLHFLHTRDPPIIHRDLKCDNIFITGTTGSVKIGDLGLSTFKNMTHAKSVIGTPEFMAPEIYDENYDESVDVYAFGMCLLEMITGEYPYAECNFPVQIYKKVTAGLKPDCFYKIPDEYMELKYIIDRCIRRNKNERMTIGELMSHDFFASDDQYGIKVEIRNKGEDNVRNNTIFQMQLRITDPKKRIEYKLNESESLNFYFDYFSDSAEDLVDQIMEQRNIPENDRNILTKMIKDKVSQFRREKEGKQEESKINKLIDVNDENSYVKSTLISCAQKVSISDHTKYGSSIPLSTVNSSNDMYEDAVKKVLKKGRFNITTISPAQNPTEKVSSMSDVPINHVKDGILECGAPRSKENEDRCEGKHKENNVSTGRTVGLSKNSLAPHSYVDDVTHHETQSDNPKYIQSLSDNLVNNVNEEIGKEIMTTLSIQNVKGKTVNDLNKKQPEENLKIIEATDDDNIDVPVFKNTGNLQLITDNIVNSNHNGKSIVYPRNLLTVENECLNKQPIKGVSSSIQDLELGIKKALSTCDDNIHQNVNISEDVSNNQCSRGQQNLSTNLIQPQVNPPESHSGSNVEELKYLLEMAQKQITLQQQMLFTVIEGKSSKTIDQCGSSKEDVNVSNNCGNNQLLDNHNQQKSTISTDDYIHQPPIHKISLQMNGTSEYLQAPLDNKKILPNTLSDNLLFSQEPPHNSVGIDEVDKKSDSINMGQKNFSDTISTTISNSRKNSVTSVYDENRKESMILNPSLYLNSNNKDTNNSSKDCLRKNSVESFNEETLKRLSSLHCNLANLLSQEVEDVLNYQTSNDASKNSSSSCHSSEHHSIIEADLNVIEKETELFKIDKLVYCTLERHKKELLELRNRQCTELREIKHLSSLMTLKTQELLRQLNVDNEESLGKKS
uniref:non-specific serine/threonine protein kinase n=1 Tax=Strongyloides venezuelensis TaxID=75913 RepID=A0A0K0G1Q1_STRVS